MPKSASKKSKSAAKKTRRSSAPKVRVVKPRPARKLNASERAARREFGERMQSGEMRERAQRGRQDKSKLRAQTFKKYQKNFKGFYDAVHSSARVRDAFSAPTYNNVHFVIRRLYKGIGDISATEIINRCVPGPARVDAKKRPIMHVGAIKSDTAGRIAATCDTFVSCGRAVARKAARTSGSGRHIRAVAGKLSEDCKKGLKKSAGKRHGKSAAKKKPAGKRKPAVKRRGKSAAKKSPAKRKPAVKRRGKSAAKKSPAKRARK